jgi:hypothetical protein
MKIIPCEEDTDKIKSFFNSNNYKNTNIIQEKKRAVGNTLSSTRHLIPINTSTTNSSYNNISTSLHSDTEAAVDQAKSSLSTSSEGIKTKLTSLDSHIPLKTSKRRYLKKDLVIPSTTKSKPPKSKKRKLDNQTIF